MALSNLAALGTIASGLAVLFSLVYLNLQVRQSIRNQRSLINQGVATRDHEIMRMLQAPHIAAVYSKSLTDAVDFTSDEFWHMFLIVRAVLGQLQDVHVQRRAGLIEQDTYDFIEAGVRGILSNPLARVVWPLVRPTVSRETAALAEVNLASTPLGERFDLSAFVKTGLTELRWGRA